MATVEQRVEMAKKVAEILNAGDRCKGRVWTSEKGHVRVYVSRGLSRGRHDEMGFISIEEDGSRNYDAMQKNKAGVRGDVEGALS